VSLYSPSGCRGKLTCFIGEAGRTEPTVVVKAMARRSHGWWLRQEVENLRAVRDLLSQPTAHALLPPPLLAAEIEGEYLVVESYCAFDQWCDPSPLARTRAHAWLRDFHRETVSERAELSESDVQAALACVARAWTLVRPHGAQRVARVTERLLHDLRGVPLVRCATHGDFSACNIAGVDGQLKVLDWEWSRLDGSPYVDLWSYQLAQLHLEAAGVEGLDQRVRAAVEHVEGELETVGVDPGFALATLPVVLSEQVIRVRRTLGAAGL